MSAVSGRLLSVYLLLAAAVIACGPSAVALGRLWVDFSDPAYTHGLALVAVFVWLVFRARQDLAAAPAKFSPPAYLALLICALAWLIFWRASVQILHEIFLLAVMTLAIFAAFGWAVVRRLAVPLLLLCFALPVWEVLAPLLQLATTQATGALLALAGVKVHIEGNLLYVPEGVFEVASACSGLNYLVAGLALATMVGEIHQDSARLRLALLALMAGLALVTNWFRVFVIVYAGHATNMQHSLVTHGHYSVGWAIFALAAMTFLWIASRLPAPDKRIPESRDRPIRPFIPAGYIAVALLLAVIPAGILVAARDSDILQQRVTLDLPTGRGVWSGPASVRDTSWQPVFVGAQARNQAVYSDGAGHEVEAFSVLYFTQRQGAELIGYDNSLPGTDLLVSYERGGMLSGAVEFHETGVVDARGEHSLIWSIYTLGKRRLASPFLVQLGYGIGSFTGQLRSGLTAFRVRCGASCDDARRVLERFTQDMGNDFQTAFLTAVAVGMESERTRRRSANLFFFRGIPS